MLDLAIDHRQQTVAQIHRRNKQPAEFGLARITGKIVEYIRNVRCYRLIGRQQAEIFIDSGGRRTVVPGSDVNVSTEQSVLSPDHKRDLAMRFQPHDPVDDVDADLLQLSRPAYVVLFVESRL